MKEVSINEYRNRLILTAVAGAIMTIYSVVLLVFGFLNANALITFLFAVIGAFGVFYFVTGYLSVVPRILHPRPLLLLTPGGLWDAKGSREEVLIPWEQISKLSLARKKTQIYIAIDFADAEAFLSTLGKARQKYAQTALRAGQPLYTINISTADTQAEDVLAELKKYRKKAMKEKGVEIADDPADGQTDEGAIL